MAEVTIIIPLYNKARQIERAIRSVLQQTFEDWHLIVVNDGSTDDGPKTVANIQDPRIELIHQSNAGPGATRNTGISRADTDYITFLDADDEWCPEFLDVTLTAIKQNNIAMVSTATLELPRRYNTLDLLRECKSEPGIFFFNGNEHPENIRPIIAMIQAKNSLMLTNVAIKYGGFYDKNKCIFGEDVVLLLRIAFNERFMIIGRPLAIYHKEDSELGLHTQSRPLEPYLKDFGVILNYCPHKNHDLIKGLLNLLILRRIINQARYGNRLQSIFLLMRYPGTRRYKDLHIKCLKHLTPGFFLWCKIKNGIHHYISGFNS